MTPSAVVSIHDVHRGNVARVTAMLDQLGQLGVRSCSLLVVANYHRRGVMTHDSAFCAWLGERSREGHEIVAHGFYHLREARTRESARDRFVTQVYTRGEGEFYDLSEFEAEYRLKLVRSTFRDAGLVPRGFIAPAWLLSAGSERALKALGFDYTVRIGEVLDLSRGSSTRSRSLVYSVRSPLRRLCSLGWNSVLMATLRRRPLLRLGLHPPDFDHKAIWNHAMHLVSKFLTTHRPVTYLDWILACREELCQNRA